MTDTDFIEATTRRMRVIPFTGPAREPMFTLVMEWVRADGRVRKDERFVMGEREFLALCESCRQALDSVN